MDIATIGLDLAKSIFQIHGVDVAGNVVSARRCDARFARAAARI